MNTMQTSETTLQDGFIKATDIGCGFLVTAANGKEVYIDDEMLKQMYLMMEKRNETLHRQS